MSLSHLAHDFATLTELQVKLLSVDLRDSKQAAGPATALLVGGAVLGLGCVPILLLALSHVLIEFAGWPASGAYALVAIVAAVLASGAAYYGWKRLMSAAATLTRSREEFFETVEWLKRSLRPGKAARSGNLN